MVMPHELSSGGWEGCCCCSGFRLSEEKAKVWSSWDLITRRISTWSTQTAFLRNSSLILKVRQGDHSHKHACVSMLASAKAEGMPTGVQIQPK